MKKELTQNDCIYLKKTGIRSMNQLLEKYISSNSPDLLKKSAMISKWLKDYSNFIDFESRFSAARNIAYKRGDVVLVNLGFNIGTELGGVHYAVILDKSNPHSATNITIIPLSSLKTSPENVHPRDCYLGNELYQKVNLKINTLTEKIQEQLRELNEIQNSIPYLTELYENTSKEELTSEEAILVHRKMPKEINILKQVLERKKSALFF